MISVASVCPRGGGWGRICLVWSQVLFWVGGYAWSGRRSFSRGWVCLVWSQVPFLGVGMPGLVPGPFLGVGMPGLVPGPLRGVCQVHPLEGTPPPRKVHPLVLTSCSGQRKGWYASYWNTFLSTKYSK